jgi:hypothetical protein
VSFGTWRFESSQPHPSMHDRPRVAAVLKLAETGLNATEVSNQLGLPRATVRDWLAGKLPHSYAPNGAYGRASGDSVCPRCQGPAHAFEQLPGEYVYLLGLYLGDGSISSHPRSVFRLRIALDAKYPGIVSDCATAMQIVAVRNRVNRLVTPDNCIQVNAYSRSWPCLFPQHGPGPKHERSIYLSSWQRLLVEREPELLLRGLIHSDGSRFINTGRDGWTCPRYSFTNHSADIQEIFCEACDLVGLRWTRSGRWTIYVSRKADVARMDEFIGPKR